ncbi:angiopoietin-1 receptor-like [Antedon mediterranea]|uniref:angiopoietin-1 receptor-like n=1 Tax=Antedon mediterranea TaxID=105859 RepID=UPI003AF9E7AE
MPTYFFSGNDRYITVLNIRPKQDNDYQYQCYIPTGYTGYSLSYGRSFAVANDDSLDETFWNVTRDERSYATPNVGMGVYYCKIVNNGVTSVVQTTRIRNDALITPKNSKNTITVNVGDDVTIIFITSLNSQLSWRKDGSTPFNIGTEKKMTFDPVETSDAGVYEMYEDGNRTDLRHAFIKLIVRACPRHKWGPPDCTGDCEYCYNGGVCDDKTGFCTCAPGFKGPTCETECNFNRHGWNCENRCTSQNNKYACRYYQFCLPDPYGCSCVTGYKGLKCNTGCSSDTFGADCAQTCHCKQGDCDRYTGICTNSSCAFPWTGSNCQKCQSGFYGENCDIECPCECYRLTGKCIEGTCDSNWLEPDCEVGILNTTFTSVNNGQRTTTSCSVYQNDAYDVQAMIIVTNNDVTENITTVIDTNRDGQNITRAFSVIADADSTYTCVISRKGYSVESDITTEIFRLPLYNGSLTILSITSSSITIEWTAWNNNTDDGDGPVVGYFLYHTQINMTNWKKTLYENSLSGTVNGLLWDTEYIFSVSAVRPGEGGEGPVGKGTVTAKTICGNGNTCNYGSIIAGTLIAGVFIGVLCTVIVAQGKQRWRKNMSKSNDDSSNAQHVYTNYASNGSSSSKPSGKIVSKSEKNETNELHIYQDYANEDNNAEYSTCDYHPNQESVYALPEESAYVN